MADDDSVAGAILGILLGLAGIAIIASIFSPRKCPYCGKEIPKDAKTCPYCMRPL
ncbi:MAG: zinc-ribbon domain-containing protein [Nitrososphaerota archaeon]|nr:zinc-ribbon domain-containing protein [Nitrososphaerota archaeon]MDG7051159.1 zinc-ribbon domain-containing protein [Nitrososphaerota archaeon]